MAVSPDHSLSAALSPARRLPQARPARRLLAAAPASPARPLAAAPARPLTPRARPPLPLSSPDPSVSSLSTKWAHAWRARTNAVARDPAARRRPHPSHLRSHQSPPFLRSGCAQGGISANRLKELCFRNGCIYGKLGQHITQLEYV